MDKYYSNENCIICVNDETENKKLCEFSVQFDKTLIFDQKMEMALLKVCSPKKIFNYGDNYELCLTMMFIKQKARRGIEIYSKSKISSNIKILHSFNFEIEENLHRNLNDVFVDKIKNINYEMNILFKEKWNEVYPNVQIPVPGEEVKTINWGPLGRRKLLFSPIRIFEWNKGKKNLSMKAGKFKVETPYIPPFSGGKGRKAEYNTVAIAFVTFNKKLHLTLGQDENNFPIAKLNESGIDPNNLNSKTPIYVKKQNLLPFKLNLSKKENFPAMIYVYMNNICDSYINDKKKSLIQTYICSHNTKASESIEFEQLLYIPMNCEEIHSISINLFDEKQRELFYEGNFSFIIHLRPIHQL